MTEKKKLTFDGVRDSFKKNVIGITLGSIALALFIMSIVFYVRSQKSGTESLTAGYQDTYESRATEVYNQWYETGFEIGEKKYHVSNDVYISVDNLEKNGKLEVLKASAVEIMVEKQAENFIKRTVWFEVHGEGTYVVNLEMAEFVVDNPRKSILVRIPRPVLEGIEVTKIDKIFYKEDNLFGGNYRKGANLQLQNYNEGSMEIQKSMRSNAFLYANAERVALSTVENLVREFNSDIPDLIVEVEFMD